MRRARLALLVSVLSLLARAATAQQPALDRYLAPLPDGAVARLGMRIESGSSTGFTRRFVAVAPDGKQLATVQGRTILVWDAGSGTVTRRLTGHSSHDVAIAFGPGNTLAVVGRDTAAARGTADVIVWDLGTLAERRFAVPDVWAGLDFSRDGRLLATTSAHPPQGNRLSVWDVTTGKRLFGDEEQFPDVCCTPDGRHVVTSRLDRAKGAATAVTVRDSATGAVVRRLSVPGVLTLGDVSPDGKTLAGHAWIDTGDPAKRELRVQLVDFDTGAVRHTLAALPIGAAARARPRFSPDGRHVAARDSDGAIGLWEVTNGKRMHSFAGNGVYANDLAFAPDGKTLFNAGPRVFAYDLTSGKPRVLTPRHTGAVECLAFAADGQRLASGGQDSCILVWQSARGDLVGDFALDGKTPFGQPSIAAELAFAPSGRQLLVRRSNGTMLLLDGATGKEIPAFRAAGFVYAFSADGRTLLWSPRRLQMTPRRPLGGTNVVTAADPELWLEAAGWLAAAVGQRELRQFRCLAYVRPGPLLPEAPHAALGGWQSELATPALLSADGRLLAERLFALGGIVTSGMGLQWADDGFRIVETHGGAALATLRSGRAALLREVPGVAVARPLLAKLMPAYYPLAFAPDGRTIAVSVSTLHAQARGPLALLDVHGGKERLRVADLPASHAPVAFSPDGRWLAYRTGDDAIAVYDLRHNKVVPTLRPDTPVRCLAFSPNGQRLASGHADATVLLWDSTRWSRP